MLDRLYFTVFLIVSCLIVSATASNRTDDAALFSSSTETILGKGNHTGTTAAPTALRHPSRLVEEHSKSATSAGSNKANISLEVSGHKVETTKLELPKLASNGSKTDVAHGTSASNKLENINTNHSNSNVKIESQKSTTLAPISTAVEKVTNTVKHAISNSVSASTKSELEHGHANETIHKFCDYMKPICDSVDKILPKALFKIQSQFKQFVQLTSGKLGMCFLEHYSFEPNLKPVTASDLKVLCSSKSLSSGAKGSYKAFANCAAANWDHGVDKELDRIIEARLNCTKNHQHSKTNATTNSVSLDHDNEDEMSLINEVVSKVLEGDKSVGSVSKTSDIKFLDLTGSTTSKPGSANSSSTSSSKQTHSTFNSTASKVKSLLNDPNTVVVFVDDSKTTTTKKPGGESTSKSKIEVAAKSSGSSTTTSKPAVLHSTVKFDLPSNVKLVVGSNKQPSTSAPSSAASKTTTTSVTSSLAHKLLSTSETSSSTSSKPALSVSTTSKPSLSSSTTRKTETVSDATKLSSNKFETVIKTGNASTTTIKVSTSASSPPPTLLTKPPPKPLESITELMIRQEKEKSEFDLKLKAERDKVLKQLQKKQDEFDAQNAIKALQIQREASASHSSDNRLHQLEHERQMTMDPIGHTMKHQQYEMSKQQRMIPGKV